METETCFSIVRLAEILGALGETFNRPVTDVTVRAYAMALDDLPMAAIEQAARRALRESTFFPTAHDIRKLAGCVDGAERVAIAWDVFEKAVVQHGGYRSVCFDDPVLNATIMNLGGWQACCEKPVEEFDKWLRKSFERVYAAFMSSRRGSTSALLGICDSENVGYPMQRPERIETGLPKLADLRLTDDRTETRELASRIGRMPD